MDQARLQRARCINPHAEQAQLQRYGASGQAQQALGAAGALISGCPSHAVAAAMRRWQAIASSNPSQSATPLTIAITGLGMRSIRRISC